ncbi:MAG TPA: SAM-dependent methyltransferase [Streptosporangiaceae bacterium]|nr:SAM-dependent methyltransferase [Streptosporangiaceae bacterium]
MAGQWFEGEPPDGGQLPPLDTSVPHIARVYDYWLGGKDNFPADRELAEQFIAADPSVIAGVRSNRAFLGRAVHYLVAEAGIRQFLDIGTGIPTANNTHEVAQRAGPDTRVVYVDNDPIVLAHARALLTGSPAGATGYVDADLRDTGTILAAAAQTLDFSQPVAVMLVGVLHCIPDEDSPGKIVGRLMDTVPAGSYLTISHPASDIHPDEMARGAALMNRSLAGSITFRPHGEVASFFAGLELVPPGLVSTTQWRPGPGTGPKPLPGWAGVAVKR